MKKTNLLIMLLAVLMSMVSTKAFAYDIYVNGIYYNYINDGTELEVTYYNDWDNESNYKRAIRIPKEVTYMDRTRKVTRIGRSAFKNCKYITSITIPNSVTSIEYYAFKGCSGLSSIDIPESVTSLGGVVFSDCTGLTSLTIPKSVTSIGEGIIEGCKNITSVSVEQGNTVYDSRNNCDAIIETFSNKLIAGCQNTIIPPTVTCIGEKAFYGCSALSSINIPNSVTTIDHFAFTCTGLYSITFPNNLKSIGIGAFDGCTGLTSLTFPNSLESIGTHAFYECNRISTLVSQIENPFPICGKASNNRAFALDIYNNVTLYVPVGTIKKYKETEGWQDFLFIEEIEGQGGETPEVKQCATPTIYYTNGKLSYKSETEGATFNYMITDTDIQSGSGDEVQLNVTYHISVYATKEGYQDSEVAEATLCWIEVDPQKEGITEDTPTDAKQMKALPVLIQAADGQISVEGAPEGTKVAVYDASGVEMGTAISRGGTTLIPTHIDKGSIAIVKIGEKAVKIKVKRE